MPTKEDHKNSKTTAHLEHITLNIISSLNARCISAPFTQHATSDYIYHHPTPSGSIIPHDATETQELLHWQFIENDPNVVIEAGSVATKVDDSGEYATVWVSLRAKGDRRGGERESVAVYYWRWEKGIGEWKWWKHCCASTMPAMYF